MATAAAVNEQIEAFCKLSGYKSADIIGSNPTTRVFITSNGGKYALSASLKVLRSLNTVPTPKKQKEAVAE